MTIESVLRSRASWHVETGDCIELLRQIPPKSVKCAVSSTPYWRQRDYGTAGQHGLERTLADFVGNLVTVFAALRPALTHDGVLFINLGDCWNGTGRAGGDYREGCKRAGQLPPPGRWDKSMKKKDLALVPAAVARGLRDEGWWLRQEIIWSKGWASPGSATDRPVTTHETVFMLAAGARYRADGASKYGTVWEFPPARGAAGHHAAMPVGLAARCIEIASSPGDLILDPYSGTGTTGVAAVSISRRYIGFELGADHAEASRRRIANALEPDGQLAMFGGVA